MAQKTSITQRLRTDLGRSVGVAVAIIAVKPVYGIRAILYPELHARLALHLCQRYFARIFQKRYKSEQMSLSVTNS